ncbi:MAG: hypothetical protein IJ806_09845 [Ruminococcus sp.]|nr:hypothetical protein [Ruminococcus sp.]MBR1864375.1 hypothetical protein [Ruminococcus sp.]
MSSATTNKRSSAGKNVLVFFIVFIILEMLLIFGIGKVFKNENVTPSIAGYSVFITNEDLLKETDAGMVTAVPKNVLVIASNGLNDAKNKIGSAILCEEMKGQATGVYWLAGVNTGEDQSGPVYTIANGNNYYEVKSSNIVGVTSSYYKTAGKVIKFITSKFGMICCAVVPLFFLVLLELIIAIATHTPDDDEYEEYEDEETQPVKQLDDFLFGGDKDEEQIAKSRKQAAENMKAAEAENAPADNRKSFDGFDFDTGDSYGRDSKKENNGFESLEEEFAPKSRPQAVEQPVAPAAPAVEVTEQTVQPEVRPAAEPQPEESFAAPAQENRAPAQRSGQRRRPRRTTASSAGAGSNASLEELMKLMEEEQAKLKSKLK